MPISQEYIAWQRDCYSHIYQINGYVSSKADSTALAQESCLRGYIDALHKFVETNQLPLNSCSCIKGSVAGRGDDLIFVNNLFAFIRDLYRLGIDYHKVKIVDDIKSWFGFLPSINLQLISNQTHSESFIRKFVEQYLSGCRIVRVASQGKPLTKKDVQAHCIDSQGSIKCRACCNYLSICNQVDVDVHRLLFMHVERIMFHPFITKALKGCFCGAAMDKFGRLREDLVSSRLFNIHDLLRNLSNLYERVSDWRVVVNSAHVLSNKFLYNVFGNFRFVPTDRPDSFDIIVDASHSDSIALFLAALSAVDSKTVESMIQIKNTTASIGVSRETVVASNRGAPAFRISFSGLGYDWNIDALSRVFVLGVLHLQDVKGVELRANASFGKVFASNKIPSSNALFTVYPVKINSMSKIFGGRGNFFDCLVENLQLSQWQQDARTSNAVSVALGALGLDASLSNLGTKGVSMSWGKPSSLVSVNSRSITPNAVSSNNSASNTKFTIGPMSNIRSTDAGHSSDLRSKDDMYLRSGAGDVGIMGGIRRSRSEQELSNLQSGKRSLVKNLVQRVKDGAGVMRDKAVSATGVMSKMKRAVVGSGKVEQLNDTSGGVDYRSAAPPRMRSSSVGSGVPLFSYGQDGRGRVLSSSVTAPLAADDSMIGKRVNSNDFGMRSAGGNWHNKDLPNTNNSDQSASAESLAPSSLAGLDWLDCEELGIGGGVLANDAHDNTDRSSTNNLMNSSLIPNPLLGQEGLDVYDMDLGGYGVGAAEEASPGPVAGVSNQGCGFASMSARDVDYGMRPQINREYLPPDIFDNDMGISRNTHNKEGFMIGDRSKFVIESEGDRERSVYGVPEELRGNDSRDIQGFDNVGAGSVLPRREVEALSDDVGDCGLMNGYESESYDHGVGAFCPNEDLINNAKHSVSKNVSAKGFLGDLKRSWVKRDPADRYDRFAVEDCVPAEDYMDGYNYRQSAFSDDGGLMDARDYHCAEEISSSMDEVARGSAVERRNNATLQNDDLDVSFDDGLSGDMSGCDDLENMAAEEGVMGDDRYEELCGNNVDVLNDMLPGDMVGMSDVLSDNSCDEEICGDNKDTLDSGVLKVGACDDGGESTVLTDSSAVQAANYDSTLQEENRPGLLHVDRSKASSKRGMILSLYPAVLTTCNVLDIFGLESVADKLYSRYVSAAEEKRANAERDGSSNMQTANKGVECLDDPVLASDSYALMLQNRELL